MLGYQPYSGSREALEQLGQEGRVRRTTSWDLTEVGTRGDLVFVRFQEWVSDDPPLKSCRNQGRQGVSEAATFELSGRECVELLSASIHERTEPVFGEEQSTCL